MFWFQHRVLPLSEVCTAEPRSHTEPAGTSPAGLRVDMMRNMLMIVIVVIMMMVAMMMVMMLVLSRPSVVTEASVSG